MSIIKHKFLLLPAASLTILAGPAYSKVYLTLEQAQTLLFPGATFQPEFRTLTADQAKAIQKASGVDVRSREVKIWRASTGGWLIADEAVGKHEFIPFVLALDSKGAVKGIEILEYREAYGGQIRDPQWRSQFTGKTAGTRLKLGKDISNISGATLSCRHITDSVTRLLTTFATLFNAATGTARS